MTKEIFGNASLFNGDALTILSRMPSGSVDAVLTDPPYSSGGASARDKQRDPALKYQRSATQKRFPDMLGDAKDQRSWTAWCSQWLGECWRIVREGAPLMAFTDWRQLPALTDAVQWAGWRWLGILAWDKLNARPNMGRFRQQCEFVVFASKGAFRQAVPKCLPGLFSCRVDVARRVHISEKPVPLLRDLLEVTAPGAVVLDPFMGGGSTGIACLETGRRFVGVELSEDYFAISNKRIRQAGEAS